jgi:hypothetical protein
MIALLTSLALAANPTIAVVGVHQPKTDAAFQASAVTAIGAAIEATGKFDALDKTELATLIAGREDIILEEAFNAPGRRPLENGRLLYESANPQEAIPAFKDAIESLTSSMATAKSAKDLWEAYIYLGVASGAVDDAAGQRAAFAAAASLAPARNPSTAKFPPDVIAAYDAVRAGVIAKPGILTITTTPPGSRVFLNGEEQGVSPMIITKVYAGLNHVTVRGDGGTSGYTAVKLEPSGTATLPLTLSAPTLGHGGDTKIARARRAGSLYRALGERNNANLTLLAGTFEDKLYLQLYSAASDGFSAPVAVPFAGDATDEAVAAIPALLATVQPDGSLAVKDQAPTAAPLDVGANPLLAQMLLNPEKIVAPVVTRPGATGTWIAVGVGVGVIAAGGTAAAVLLSANAEPVNNGTIILNPPE